MKKLTLLAMSTAMVFVLNVGNAADFKSFDDVRAQYQSYRDPTRVSYLFNRCAALQLNVSALLQRQGEKKGAQDFENLAHHYMVLSEANEREIDKKRGVKSKDLMKTVSRNVANVSEIYSRRLRENYAKRGEYLIGDAQLEAELAECNLPEVFKNKLTAN
jgi:hypothetical protein